MFNPSKREIATIKLVGGTIGVLLLMGYCLGANLGETPQQAHKRAQEADKAIETIQAYQR